MRTGLLGASAVMAMGAVAVASGLLPGGGTGSTAGGGPAGGPLQTGDLPDLEPQGTPSAATPTNGVSAPTGPTTGLPGTTPSQAPSGDRLPSSPSLAPPEQSSGPATGRGGSTAARPSHTPEGPAPSGTAPAHTSPGAENATESKVVTLVNRERKAAGCRPVTPDRKLAGLAEHFSEDMAERGFFGHIDPDGATPWDRAVERGVTSLGGENIARGQRDAQAVMDAWMSNFRHRANILNCDYRTVGVGVHFGDGGPWWTQDFGLR